MDSGILYGFSTFIWILNLNILIGSYAKHNPIGLWGKENSKNSNPQKKIQKNLNRGIRLGPYQRNFFLAGGEE